MEIVPHQDIITLLFLFDDKLWIFGGTNDDGILNDLYTFDIKNNIWKKVVNTKGDIPPHHGHTATFYHKEGDFPKMIIFGGGRWNNNERVYMNQIYSYDFINNSWECVLAQGSIPCGRSFHSSVLYQNSLIIFGGWWMTENGSKRREYYTNDLLQFNLVTNTWNHITATGSPPGPRNRHSCVVLDLEGSTVFLFFWRKLLRSKMSQRVFLQHSIQAGYYAR